MEVTRKRVHFGKVTAFVDPRSDLLVDKKEKIFLHYLPDGDRKETNRNAIKYKLVNSISGYYLRFLGSFNYQTAIRQYVKSLIASGDEPYEVQQAVRKATVKVPERAKEIIMETLEDEVGPIAPIEEISPEAMEEVRENWIEKVAESFSIRDFVIENDAVIKGKSGAEHKFDLVVTPRGREKTRIAFLNELSEDTINDIMMFNALADDCDIELKVISLDRDLEDPAINLLNDYHISVYDKRSDEIVTLHPSALSAGELDVTVYGVMKKGKVCMISGKAGVGKTLLSTQYLVQGAERGENGAILLTERSGVEYIEEAKGFAPDFEKFYRRGTIQVIELSKKVIRYKEKILGSSKDFVEYVSVISSEMERVVDGSNVQRLVIDSIRPLIGPNEKLINLIFNALAFPRTAVVITSSVRESDLSTYGIEEGFASSVIKLERVEGESERIKASIVKRDGETIEPISFYFRTGDLTGKIPMAIHGGS